MNIKQAVEKASTQVTASAKLSTDGFRQYCISIIENMPPGTWTGLFRSAQFKVTKVEYVETGDSSLVVEWIYALETFIPVRIRKEANDPCVDAMKKVVVAVMTRLCNKQLLY